MAYLLRKHPAWSRMSNFLMPGGGDENLEIDLSQLWWNYRFDRNLRENSTRVQNSKEMLGI